MGGGMSGGMPVAFVWNTRVTLFHAAWETETTFTYLCALLGVFALCILQERLFYFRTSYTISPGHTPGDLTTPILPRLHKVPELQQRVFGTVLYGLNLSSSYLIMLAVMTCNGGVFITVVAGLSAGHFLYKSTRPMSTHATRFRGEAQSSEACCVED